MIYRISGFSLIELLLILSILAFLLLNLGLPEFHKNREKKLISAGMQELAQAISMARQSAVAENLIVTFCPGKDALRCEGKWHEGSIIFTDRNADRIINQDDRLLFRLEPIKTEGSISFNSFRNRQYLQMTPRGFTNYQNGNFTYCPANGDTRLAQQLILSLSGRTRMAKDSDGDGIIEDSQGRPLACK